MTDRTAAHAYGQIMTMAARQKKPDHGLVDFILRTIGKEDFHTTDANADEALVDLGVVDSSEYGPGGSYGEARQGHKGASWKSAFSAVAKVFRRNASEGHPWPQSDLEELKSYAKKYKVKLLPFPAARTREESRRASYLASHPVASVVSLPDITPKHAGLVVVGSFVALLLLSWGIGRITSPTSP